MHSTTDPLVDRDVYSFQHKQMTLGGKTRTTPNYREPTDRYFKKEEPKRVVGRQSQISCRRHNRVSQRNAWIEGDTNGARTYPSLQKFDHQCIFQQKPVKVCLALHGTQSIGLIILSSPQNFVTSFTST